MDGAIKRSRNLRISKIIASKVLGEDIIIFLEFYIFEDSFEITISFRTKKKSVEKIFNSFSNSRFKNLPPPLSPQFSIPSPRCTERVNRVGIPSASGPA